MASVTKALEQKGAHPDVISLALGSVRGTDGTAVAVDKTSQVAASVLYDAVYVPGGAGNTETFIAEFTAAIGEHRFPQREGARGGIGRRHR